MKKPLCNGCKKRPKTIANDVKEKYKTSPPQTCGEKGITNYEVTKDENPVSSIQ